jgi:hypothetical protein
MCQYWSLCEVACPVLVASTRTLPRPFYSATSAEPLNASQLALFTPLLGPQWTDDVTGAPVLTWADLFDISTYVPLTPYSRCGCFCFIQAP